MPAAAGVYGWLHFIKTKKGREFWDSHRIQLPVFGEIAHKICLARFTRTLASLIRSGVPILEVLHIVSQTVGNVVMEKAVLTSSADIERGESMSSALSKHPVFPSMIIRMITAGEQTGKMDNMLERISDFLDEEIETTLSGLTSLIEPILIVFLGVVIGGMVDLHVPADLQAERDCEVTQSARRGHLRNGTPDSCGKGRRRAGRCPICEEGIEIMEGAAGWRLMRLGRAPDPFAACSVGPPLIACAHGQGCSGR